MFLIITNSADVTADFMEGHLDKVATPWIRINTDELVQNVRLEGDHREIRLRYRGTEVSSSSVSGVWYRRPQPIAAPPSESLGEARHFAAEWAEALEAFLAQIPRQHWINHPMANAAASIKLEQLARATSYGLDVPQSVLTQDPERASAFISSIPRAIAKPLSYGYIEEESEDRDVLIYTSEVANRDDLGAVSSCPTLFQRQIVKTTDVRVTTVDGQMVAVSMRKRDTRGEQILDIRSDNFAGVQYEIVNIPRELGSKLLRLVHSYSLRFAAVDFCVDESGRWFFLEINPNGQWAWLDLEAGTRIWEKLACALRTTPAKDLSTTYS